MPELIPAAPGTAEWLAARRAGVTATDIVTILGLSASNSAYSLFWQKMGQVPEPADSDRFRLGRELEPYVIERWAEDHPDLYAGQGGLQRSTDRPWQLATLDRGVWEAFGETGARRCGVLEVKTWADADRHSWADAPPAAVRAQVLWQMDVMDVATGHVGVVFLPSGEFRSYVIEHDAGAHAVHGQVQCSVCEDIHLMQLAGLEFWHRLQLDLPAPDPDASAATLAAVRARFTRQPDKEAEVSAAAWDDWSCAKFDLGLAEGAVREAEIRLREQAGEASVLTVDGQPVARRIVSESQVRAHVRRMDYLKRIKTEGAE